MWEIVRAGGWMMGPIILASIIAVAIILERLWTLQDRRVLPHRPDPAGLAADRGRSGHRQGDRRAGPEFAARQGAGRRAWPTATARARR